jgi:hypothetical protein
MTEPRIDGLGTRAYRVPTKGLVNTARHLDGSTVLTG